MIRRIILVLLLFCISCCNIAAGSGIEITVTLDTYIDCPAPVSWGFEATTYDWQYLDMYVSEGEDDLPKMSVYCRPVELNNNVVIKSITVDMTMVNAVISSGKLTKTFFVEVPNAVQSIPNINSFVPIFNSVFQPISGSQLVR